MILLIDNYDSFVFNLARYFECLDQPTRVVRNDAINVAAIRRERPQAIVISPGPCTPNEAGCSLEVVAQLAGEIPILGVCLGHQAIGQAFGARVVRAAQPMHGRTSNIEHADTGIFRDVPSPLTVSRYHSLILERATLPDCMQITATTADGTIMAIQHRDLPVYGVQFHPESILTECGHAMLANFLQLAGLERRAPIPDLQSELSPPLATFPLPTVPVTF
ncbi:MAG: aminodeoxychorismate/anthranilate synthase component II [Planctomycetaceae bacterium]|nr:aminodeoxychorismate/anthranilate synthase component II [Planctomycetaceae bacterium]